MPERRLAPLLLLAALGLAVPARGEIARLEARYWLLDSAEGAGVEVGLVPGLAALGTRLDLEVDEAPELRVALSPLGSLELRAAFLETDLSGDGRVRAALPLIVPPIEIDARLVAGLELEYARVGLAWPFIRLPGGLLRLGPLVEVKAFRGEVSAGLPDLPEPLSAAVDYEAATAAAGAVLAIQPLERLELFSEISFSLDTGQVDLTDFEAGLRFRPNEFLSAMAGWRILELEVAEGAVRLEADLEGLFAGVGLHF